MTRREGEEEGNSRAGLHKHTGVRSRMGTITSGAEYCRGSIVGGAEVGVLSGEMGAAGAGILICDDCCSLYLQYVMIGCSQEGIGKKISS